MPHLIDVKHVPKRGYSSRITVPKKVLETSGIKEEEILEF
jgi:bifunctional DNA-binding transcriptional regulator/antitoxin component of YhaV-PrlF toxin-antitoxin module